MVVYGQIYHLAQFPAFLAFGGGSLVGAVTYVRGAEEFEVLSLDRLSPGAGIGTALLDKVEGAARAAGCCRVAVVTTNDNLHALRFYQRRGYRLTGVDPGAVDHSRTLKSTIPTLGNYGIPVRDKLTLSKSLDEASAATHGEVR
jgi:hypothetical protein